MIKYIVKKKKCRSCEHPNFLEIFSLGNFYLSDFVEGKAKPKKSPLDLVLCLKCFLLQLKHTTSRSLLYTERYGYRSGVNKTMKDELSDIVKKALNFTKKLKDDEDIVLDIGSSDATLLKNYPEGILKIGFDPIEKFRKYFNEPNMYFVKDFFNHDGFKNEFGNSKAKIITAIAVFYDIDEPNKFLADLRKILHPDGIFIIQQNYLVEMLKNNAIDNVVHEHLCYYSINSLKHLLSRHNLEIFDVELRRVNGGSLRTYVCHKGRRPVSKAVYSLEEEELKRFKLDKKETYLKFKKEVEKELKRLRNYIVRVAKKRKTIYVYGASTRGNTVLQFCGLDESLIKAAVERNPEKWGKKIASVGIPIISEEEARKNQPDYMLVLPWFFREEFIEREKEYLQKGGKFIFPLPEFEVFK